jgi:GNAT superfamily N-acetyltransferase
MRWSGGSVLRATLEEVPTVRRIRAGDSGILRDVRLAALSESPSAFASTFAAEAALPATHWSQRAADTAAGSDSAIFVALVEGQAIGIVGSFRTAVESPLVRLGAMWTAPAHRGCGVGRRLVGAVLEWAGQCGVREVELWVTDGNVAALALYQSTGFTLTGEQQPLPSDPSLTVLRMTQHPPPPHPPT